MTTDSDLNLLKQLIKFNSSKRTRKKVPSWTKTCQKSVANRGVRDGQPGRQVGEGDAPDVVGSTEEDKENLVWS